MVSEGKEKASGASFPANGGEHDAPLAGDGTAGVCGEETAQEVSRASPGWQPKQSLKHLEK